MSTLGITEKRLKRKASRSQEDGEENHEKRSQEKWKKRRQTCYRKFMELSMLCEADVYALIRRHGKIYTLKTTLEATNHELFPPPEAALGGLKGKPGVADFQQRSINEPLLGTLETTSRPVRAGAKKRISGKTVIQPPVWVTSPLKEKFLEK
ncbi:hypothetical protein AJ80_09404 [Polytolypa hystricis UAMH7299]|uniref:MADS-box domain-containing protein n=1 Tax=Polytolypa hystricis (strain UAMH7299) TaxID=1447883 RepID=A0A2B7WRL9_POLH7|nr:hypothetical protein AJ80_09404 [Polytolypa hystricis UAMH7299]